MLRQPRANVPRLLGYNPQLKSDIHRNIGDVQLPSIIQITDEILCYYINNLLDIIFYLPMFLVTVHISLEQTMS